MILGLFLPLFTPLFMDYQQKGKLEKHQKAHHAEFWDSRPERTLETGYIERRLKKSARHFRCHLCPKSKKTGVRFLKKDKLVKHIHKHHPEVMSIRKLTEEDELRQYDEVYFDENTKKFVCTLCGFTARPHQVKRHVDSKHRKKTVATCETCGKTFTHMQVYREHQYTHTGNYPSVCQYCGKGFKNEYRLREVHKKKHHPVEYEQEKRILEMEKQDEEKRKDLLKRTNIPISEIRL